MGTRELHRYPPCSPAPLHPNTHTHTQRSLSSLPSPPPPHKHTHTRARATHTHCERLMTWQFYRLHNLHILPDTFNSYALLNSVKYNLKERYFSFWKNQISNDEGMQNLIKQTFGLETYLENLHDINIKKKCICSFRISTHRLRTERAVYWWKARGQVMYVGNLVENEIHFLCQCKKIWDFEENYVWQHYW